MNFLLKKNFKIKKEEYKFEYFFNYNFNILIIINIISKIIECNFNIIILKYKIKLY